MLPAGTNIGESEFLSMQNDRLLYLFKKLFCRNVLIVINMGRGEEGYNLLQTSFVSKNCTDANHEGNICEKQLCNSGGQQLCALFLHTAILEVHPLCFRGCFFSKAASSKS